MVRHAARILGCLAVLASAVLLSEPGHADAAEDRLAAMYSPVVVIPEHSVACGAGEPYLPVPVEAVLGQAAVTLRGPQGQAIAAPTAADLAGKGDGWFLDLPGNPLSPGCGYERWFDATSRNVLAPTVYAHVATDPDHPGMLALQYWFFWVYNDWNDRHEGDWEMVQILFDANSATSALTTTPASTAFAQHEGSETSLWDDPKLLRVGNHVVVYPGQGSHAAYYSQAEWFGRNGASGFGCDSTLAPGVEIDPEIAVLSDAGGIGSQWLTFTGRWGEKAPSFNNGPTGPNTKTQWKHPVTWQQEQGREAAAVLPVVGGPAVDSFCTLTRAGSLLFIAALDHPVSTSLLVIFVIVLLLLLAKGTRWRGADSPHPDLERRAGQVVTASFGFIRGHFSRLWPVMGVIALTSAADLGLQRAALQRRPSGDITDVYDLADNPVGLVIALAIPFITVPLIMVFLAATTRLVEQVARGERGDPWRSLADSFRHPTAALVQLTVWVIVTAAASSIVLLPLALWLVALWAVSLPAAAIEGLTFRSALRRSRMLTRGRRWRAVLLGALLIWIGLFLPDVVGALLLLATGLPYWATNILSIMTSAILLTFSAIGLTLQYYDFRAEERRDVQTRPDER